MTPEGAPGEARSSGDAAVAPEAAAPSDELRLRPAPRRLPVGEDTWKIFELLKKSRKLARSLEKDGFPATGKQQLAAIEQRVGELRRRFRELEQLLRTRELDLKHAERAIGKLHGQRGRLQSDAEVQSLQRAMDHALRHREHILSVLEARNNYVMRLQELFHHVRQLHSRMMLADRPSIDTDGLIDEIDALVESVDSVDVVRKEVQATLAQDRARAAAVRQ